MIEQFYFGIQMQFDKRTIARLAEEARTGPQKQISVDLKRVRREALYLQKEYEKEARNGPVSSFEFLNTWAKHKDTKYLCTKVASLSKIIAGGRFDMNKFEYMMNMGKMVERGRMREFDASVMVGQKFANEYVAPVAQSQQEDGGVGESQNTKEDSQE